MTVQSRRGVFLRGEVLEWIRNFTSVDDIDIIRQAVSDRAKELRNQKQIQCKGKRVTVTLENGSRVKGTVMCWLRSMAKYKVMTDYGKMVLIGLKQIEWEDENATGKAGKKGSETDKPTVDTLTL